MKAVFSKLYKNRVEPMEDQLPSTSTSVKEELPQTFNVRYLGFREAKGLWGIKHTRKPVDTMVASVKESKSDLHIVKLILTKDGCKLESIFKGKIETRYFPIETISYGVQDLVYTRVFAMIIVKEKSDFPHQSPFECHAFVCDSRQSARKLTYTLATAFQEYSKKIRSVPHTRPDPRKRFAIDLRTPEEMRTELRHQDSEA
ncbi:uncharacterized protein LOC135836363 [Planococcus citri]|uniref:uncharacterized protein LOC135836363 n=1 Tax=Planococcus citri TaxID=170843 RepID=UPI0031F77347